MHKAHQVIQDSYHQVLNQVKEEADKDEEVIRDLKLQNNELLCQMTKKGEETTELKSLIKDMQQLVNKLTTIVNQSKSGEQPKSQFYYSYCWTHRRTNDKKHTSATCTRPNPGHDKTATIVDKKKGSNLRCE